MTNRSPHGIALAENTPHSLGLGRGLDNDQFTRTLFNFFRLDHARMCFCPAHTEQFRPTDTAGTLSNGRTGGVESCLRVDNFPFGLALHAIGFHELPPKDNLPAAMFSDRR